MRPKKTDIIRKRTGCQRCRSKRRQCDETRPDCLACVQRGVPCSGYQNRIGFKDLSERTAEVSRKVEAARWSALRSEDARQSTSRNTLPPSSTQLSHDEGPVEGQKLDGPLIDYSLTQGVDGSPSLASTVDVGGGNQQHLGHFYEQSFDSSVSDDDACAIQVLAAKPSPTIKSSYPWPRVSNDDASSRCGVIASTPFDNNSHLLPAFTADDRSQLVPWTAPQDDSTSWEDLLDFPGPSRTPTPLQQIPSPDTTRQCAPMPTEEALLATFENDIARRIAAELPYADLFRISSGLRAAALALATAYHRLSQPAGDEVPDFQCHYYDFAVADIAHQLKRPKNEAGDSLVGTLLLLMYRDLAVGSHRDVCGRLQQLEALSSSVDLGAYCNPAMFRAWRLLTYEVRARSLATRRTAPCRLPPQGGATSDSQLTIRDISSAVWTLHARAIMEASSSSQDQDSSSVAASHSASRKAVQWMCSALGRRCDRRQWEQQDFHDHSLSNEAITGQCAMFEERLDAWHRALPRADLPVPCLGSSAECIVSGGSFGAIVPYELADDGKAVDYALYLLSRMTCLYLESRYRAQDSRRAPGLASEALARVVLGIILKMGLSPTCTEPDNALVLLYKAVMLSEGTSIANAFLEGLMPVFRRSGLDAAQKRQVTHMQGLVEAIVKERYAGRSVRLAIDSVDDDHDAVVVSARQGARKHAVFGDFGGRGQFRDIILVDVGAQGASS